MPTANHGVDQNQLGSCWPDCTIMFSGKMVGLRVGLSEADKVARKVHLVTSLSQTWEGSSLKSVW